MKCKRCGIEDEDLRTLWMACLYAMEELNLPLKQLKIKGTLHEKIGTRKILGVATVPVWSDEPIRDDWWAFYTMRVCKDCRAEWMSAIKGWFEHAKPKGSCGSGMFIRRNGATIEVTEEEFLKMQKNKIDIRVRGLDE